MAFQLEGRTRCIATRVNSDGTTRSIEVVNDVFRGARWIPYWAIDEDSEVYALNTEGVLLVDESFAEDRGWL